VQTASGMFAGISRHSLLAILVIGLHLLLGWVLTVGPVVRVHMPAAEALAVTFFLSDTHSAQPPLISDPPLRTFSNSIPVLPARIEEDSDPTSAMAITVPASDRHDDCNDTGDSSDSFAAATPSGKCPEKPQLP